MLLLKIVIQTFLLYHLVFLKTQYLPPFLLDIFINDLPLVLQNTKYDLVAIFSAIYDIERISIMRATNNGHLLNPQT